MKRRKFLGILSIGVVGTAVGVAAFTDFEMIVKTIISNDTKDLNVSEEIIERYLKDAHEKRAFQHLGFSKKEFIRINHFLGSPSFFPYRNKYEQYRSEIVGHFLLSTDFFSHKMDTSRVIKYESFYDPYFRPCSHPFSNLFYTS